MARVAASRLEPQILTIGHSTRPFEEFLELLKQHQVGCVADVRTIPGSRHNPQFNRETLAEALRRSEMTYLHLPHLGGLRRARPDSINTGWRNASFRGFADYMQTEEFAAGLQELLVLAQGGRVALMCAEAVPWRCHRSLIADALLARKIPVAHIMGLGALRPAQLTPFARRRRGKVVYPAESAK